MSDNLVHKHKMRRKDTKKYSYTQVRAHIFFKNVHFVSKKQNFQFSTFNFQLFFVPLYANLDFYA